MNRTAAVVMVLLILLSGCSSTKLVPVVTTPPTLTLEPPLGEVRTAEIGDSLVRASTVAQQKALYLRSEITKAKAKGMAMGSNATVRPGILVERYADGEKTCYESLQTITLGGMSHAEASGGICVMKNNPGLMLVYWGGPGMNALFEPQAPVEVEFTTYFDRNAPGFWQELSYNGKSGNTVKFLYREYSSEMARPAFDQNVEYDLADGRVVGFKGARIEILDATNTSVTYKVLAHFPVR